MRPIDLLPGPRFVNGLLKRPKCSFPQAIRRSFGSSSRTCRVEELRAIGEKDWGQKPSDVGGKNKKVDFYPDTLIRQSTYIKIWYKLVETFHCAELGGVFGPYPAIIIRSRVFCSLLFFKNLFTEPEPQSEPAGPQGSLHLRQQLLDPGTDPISFPAARWAKTPWTIKRIAVIR